jgi:hypothetical protein
MTEKGLRGLGQDRGRIQVLFHSVRSKRPQFAKDRLSSGRSILKVSLSPRMSMKLRERS